MKKEIEKRVQVSIKLDPERDSDIIEVLKREKKQTLVKKLIRDYIEERQKPNKTLKEGD